MFGQHFDISLIKDEIYRKIGEIKCFKFAMYSSHIDIMLSTELKEEVLSLHTEVPFAYPCVGSIEFNKDDARLLEKINSTTVPYADPRFFTSLPRLVNELADEIQGFITKRIKQMVKSIVIIPARFESTRLPAKMLLCATGKPLIQHTWEAALKAKIPSAVCVATDCLQIYDTVNKFGGTVFMTSPTHQCGTDRLAEAVKYLRLKDDDIIVNLQGDEPEIDSEYIDHVIRLLSQHPNAAMATLSTPITNYTLVDSASCVKVVTKTNGEALYFSRSQIPWQKSLSDGKIMQHIGIYAYRKKDLLDFVSLSKSHYEKAESLEQLRAIEAGLIIQVGVVDKHTAGIDTLKDYEEFTKRYNAIHGKQ